MRFPWNPARRKTAGRVRADWAPLRAVADTAGVDPIRLAAALNDPIGHHMASAELERVGPALLQLNKQGPTGMQAVLAFSPRFVAACDIAIAHKAQKRTK